MLKKNSSHYQDFTNLDQWLYYLENLHRTEIDLGLSRISIVAARLEINLSFAKVITVAGTNGKGTTCAFIENALLNSGYNNIPHTVAVYSSPHIEHFNERLRINKVDVKDKQLINAFKQIEQAREDISLSYYEYTTLAALLVLMEVKPAFIILEVGLGGRLDATNIIDADIAVITTIDLDHQLFLGTDRESIGFEKAGIMRESQVIVIGDTNSPKSVLNHALDLSACHGENLFLREHDFAVIHLLTESYSPENRRGLWDWKTPDLHLTGLNPSFIPQDNVATAIMVLKQLDIEITSDFINKIISITKVAGRTELFTQSGNCDVILDVGHNPQATRYLAKYLKNLKKHIKYNKVYGIVSMLGDKDISASLQPLTHEIDYWYTGPLDVPRAASKEVMKSHLSSLSENINCFDNIDRAFKMANEQADSSDLILVFGSFFTVAKIRPQLVHC